jgi:hypothetical protein
MHYVVRIRWELKEKDRKEPSIGSMTRIVTADTEKDARADALAWHKSAGIGGRAVIESCDEMKADA